jgi:iron complex transport system substrate-binding protein
VWPTSREGCRLFFCRGRASYFETLYLPGEQERIVGISGYVVRPPQARREKPRVSAFTSANIDKILALRPGPRPDLFRSPGRSHPPSTRSTNRSVAGILDMIRMLGALVEASERAEEPVGALEARLAEARSARTI